MDDYSQEVEVPEWQSKYVKYTAFCSWLNCAVKNISTLRAANEETKLERVTELSSEFFESLYSELRKTESFYCDKLEEARARFLYLKSSLADLSLLMAWVSTAEGNNSTRMLITSTKSVIKTQRSKLLLAVTELHLSVELLLKYKTTNFQRFLKITAKHDRLMSSCSANQWCQTFLQESSLCHDQYAIETLLSDITKLFTESFAQGDRERAKGLLHRPSYREAFERNYVSMFTVGTLLGTCLVLSLIAIICIVRSEEIQRLHWQITIQLFRGVFLAAVFIILLAINLYGWMRAGINRVLLFESDSKNSITHLQMFEIAGAIWLLWITGLLVYLLGDDVGVKAYLAPMLVAIGSLVILLNPIRIFYYSARMWLLKLILRVAAAPFYRVRFVDIWFGDQLISIVTMLLDFEFLICYYAVEIEWLGTHTEGPHVCNGMIFGIRPFIALLPAWFRLAQCLRCYRDTRLFFPYIINAGKYSTTFLVVFFSSMHVSYASLFSDSTSSTPVGYVMDRIFFCLWIVAALVSSLYTFLWDVMMDWRLLDGKAGANWPLRKDMIYKQQWVFYFAMIQNLFLRFTWTLTMSVGEWGGLYTELAKTIVAILELFRRFVWNFFRLELEQLSNNRTFKAVRDVDVTLDTRGRHILQLIPSWSNSGQSKKHDSTVGSSEDCSEQAAFVITNIGSYSTLPCS